MSALPVSPMVTDHYLDSSQFLLALVCRLANPERLRGWQLDSESAHCSIMLPRPGLRCTIVRAGQHRLVQLFLYRWTACWIFIPSAQLLPPNQHHRVCVSSMRSWCWAGLHSQRLTTRARVCWRPIRETEQPPSRDKKHWP